MATESGFMVAELVVAAAILLTVVTAAMGGIMFASRSAAMAAHRVEALSIANQQIELARNLPFDDVATTISSNGLPSGKIPSSQTIGQYTVVPSVAYGTYNANTGARYKTMTVTVSWTKPIAGSITDSTIIAGFSATQDYNFGTVGLQVQDESGANLAGVTVNMTDLNGRAYSGTTAASGTVMFDYVPSGNVSFSATKPGYVVDSPSSPSCTANVITPPYLVTAHLAKTGTVRCLSADGTVVSGIPVTIATAPIPPTTRTSDADGKAIFGSQLIAGTFAITTAANTYYAANASPGSIVISTTDVTKDITLTAKPAVVTATRSNSGTIYVWNPGGGTAVTSVASRTSSPYTATINLTNNNSDPRLYYFTKTNTYSTTNPLTVTAGQSYSLTVN